MPGYADAIMRQMGTIGQPNVTTTELTQPKQNIDLAQLGMLLMFMLQGMGDQGKNESIVPTATPTARTFPSNVSSMGSAIPANISEMATTTPNDIPFSGGSASPLAAGGRFGAANINPMDLIKMMTALRGMKRTI